jgi:DNA-binding transcriptional regulator YhcF (GntR family)
MFSIINKNYKNTKSEFRNIEVKYYCGIYYIDIEKYEREHKEKEWSEYVNYMIDEAMKTGLNEQEIKERQRIRRIINKLNEP